MASIDEAISKLKGASLIKQPSSESFLRNALDVVGETGKTGFQVGQGFLQNLPQNIAENPTSFAMSGVPGVQFKAGTQPYGLLDESMEPETTQFSDKYLKPQSGVGQVVGGLGNFITSMINPYKAISSTPNLIREGVTSSVQKAFFPWQKGIRTEYGQKLGTGIRDLIKTGQGNVTPKETNALFSGLIRPRTDVAQQLPLKAKQVGRRVADKGMSIKQLRTEKARLGRSLTVGERGGKVSTERGKIINDAIKRISAYMKSKIPNLPRTEYGKFLEKKGVIEGAFEPGKARLGSLGTAKGTSTLKGIKNLQPAEKQAIGDFGKEAGVSILGPAGFANLLDSLGSGLKKTGAVAAIGGPTLAATGYGLNKLFRNLFSGGGESIPQ